ncbi:MAG TPA: gamma-glutamylcyclotransferase family protein [Candidatus Xenobia bacterium]
METWPAAYDPALADGVVVYGTLKQGLSNHRVVEPFVQSIEPATFQGRLYNGHGYPAVTLETHAGPAGTVHGEFITVKDPDTAFRHLDRLEGFNPHHQGLYQRSVIDVILAGGDHKKAWVYHMPETRAASRGRWLEAGVWPKRLQNVANLNDM